MTDIKTKPLTFNMTEDQYHDHDDSNDGLCLNCGELSDSQVEPDARGYRCNSCHKDKIYGIQELMLMGRINIVETEE